MQASEEEPTNNSTVGIAVGVSVGVTALITTVIIFAILKKKRKLCFSSPHENEDLPDIANPYLEDGLGEGSKGNEKIPDDQLAGVPYIQPWLY